MLHETLKEGAVILSVPASLCITEDVLMDEKSTVAQKSEIGGEGESSTNKLNFDLGKVLRDHAADITRTDDRLALFLMHER